MNDGPVLTDDELAAEAGRLLREAARARTAGSVHLVRQVRRAIRRDRRRRVAGGAAAVAAVTAGVFWTAPLAGVLDAAPPSPGQGVTTGVPAWAAGGTAGSLGDDADWLASLRRHVVDQDLATEPREVRVLWADDASGRRRAVTVSTTPETGWLMAWEGPAGAEATASEQVAGTRLDAPGGRLPASQPPEFLMFRDGRDAEGNPVGGGVVVVVGSGITAVVSRTGVNYKADGRGFFTQQPFTAAGAVWVRTVPASEMGSLEVRWAGADGVEHLVGGAYTGHRDTFTLVMDGVTAPGADRAVVACAASAFGSDGTSDRTFPAGSTAVLADARRVRGEWHAVAVARASGGAYLVGTCRRPDSSGDSRSAQELGSFVLPAPAGGPAALFALTTTELASTRIGERPTRAVVTAVVVAPQGATEVEVAGVTAAVRYRVAYLTLPAGTPEQGLRATARGADGTVLGTTPLARTPKTAP